MKKLLTSLAAALLLSAFIFPQTIDLGEIITVVERPEKVEIAIDSEEIKKSAFQDLPQLLKSKGMLVMSSGGSGTASNFSYKGYAGFCCKVYIDGVLATQPGTGEFDWNSIDINSIESITVSEIPDTITDQFAGCVVHIRTRLVSVRGYDLKTLVTSYENSIADTVSVTGEYRDVIGNTGIKLNAQVNKADNNYETPDLPGHKGKTLEGNWSRLGNVSGSFNSHIADNFTVSGTSKTFYNQVKAFGTGTDRSYGIEEDFNVFNTVKARLVAGKQSVFSVSVTSQFNQIDYDATMSLHEKTQMHQGDLLLTAENFYGFEASSVFSLENKITGTKQQRLHNTTKVAWTSDFLLKNFQSTENAAQWITVKPCAGVLVSSNDDFEFLPQITVSSRKTGLAVSAFRQFVLPTFNQLYWDGSGGTGNPDLEPEEGWAVVTSWKSPFTVLPVTVIYTYAKYGNKIRWSYSDGKLMPMNTVDATYKTLEVRASKSWKYLELNGGVTNTQALLEDGNQIMWVPEWQWNCGATAHIYSVDAGVTFNYTGRRPKQNDNEDWYDEYSDLGASINWHVTEELTIMLSGKNLLDHRSFYHDSYPMPSRSVTCGVRVQK